MSLGPRATSIAVAALLAGAAVFTTIRTVRPANQLKDANVTIAALEEGSLRSSSQAPRYNGYVSLVPLGANSTAPSTSRHCDTCDLNDGAEALSYAARKAMSSVPQLSLLDLKHRYLPSERNTEYTLFIFFSPIDCPACLSEASAWERLAKEGSSLHLSVVGIVDRCSRTEADSARKTLSVTFPVLFDRQSLLRTLYGILKTPQKVLVDKKGNVMLASPADQTPDSQAAFERQIREACKRL